MQPFCTSLALLAALALVLVSGEKAHAAAVISEVLWAGSDLSASDEWVEIAGFDQSTSLEGWTLTRIGSDGAESAMFTFPAGAAIDPGQFILVSHFPADQSRLALSPDYVSAAISLLNSKLLLRLRDSSGQIMDEIDDGVGAPFAGQTTPIKASMERIRLESPGTDSGNWQTATVAVGFDEGSAVLGTPGSAGADQGLGSGEGSDSESSSSSSSLSSGLSSISSFSSISSSSVTSVPSAPSSCVDPQIIIQSGTLRAETKVTINIQVTGQSGGPQPSSCLIDFGDGTQSASCNPSSHTYDNVGSYTLKATVDNKCGGTVERLLTIEVLPGASSSAASAPVSEEPFLEFASVATPGIPFAIAGTLPNPKGNDTGQEWAELRNLTDQPASLEGWILKSITGKRRQFTFGGVTIPPQGRARFLLRDWGLSLGNEAGELSLITPGGAQASVVRWKNAAEGKVYGTAVATASKMEAIVKDVVDGDTLDVSVHQSGRLIPERVRLIGVDAPEMNSRDATQATLARRAAELLEFLLADGSTITLITDGEPRDAYGRLLGYAELPGGGLLQEELLRQGLAQVEMKFPCSRREAFLHIQKEAQEERVGIWSVAGTSEGGGSSTMVVNEGRKGLGWGLDSGLGSSTYQVPNPNLNPNPNPAALETIIWVKPLASSKSSAAKKKTVAKKPVATTKKSSKSSSKKFTSSRRSSDSAIFSPLHSASSLSFDKAVQELIEEPDIIMGSLPQQEEKNQEESLPWGTAILSVFSTVTGVGGWLLGKGKR